MDASTFASISALIHWGEEAVKGLTSNDRKIAPKLAEDLKRRYSRLFDTIISRQLPLSQIELNNMDSEFKRLFDLKEVYVKASFPGFYDNQVIDAKSHPVTKIYDHLLEVLDTPMVYSNELKKGVDFLLQVK